MASPSEKDFANWRKILERLSKGLLEDGSPKRKMDENRAKELFRQAVRKRWMHCNQKLHYLESCRVPDTDSNTRRKWKYQCAMCGGWFKKDEVDVDHIEGEKSFVNWDQAFEYASSILDVGRKDLQLLCNGDTETNCHRVKSTCERLGLDWKNPSDLSTARFEIKLNDLLSGECKKAKEQKDWLSSRGIVPEPNPEKRKEQIREALLAETSNMCAQNSNTVIEEES